MILFKSFPFVFLLCIPASIVFAQTTSYYTAYQTSFPYVTGCSMDHYYDVALLQCSACPDNAQQKANDPTQCDCISTSYYYGVNQGGGSLICTMCRTGYFRSSDGFGCVAPDASCNAAVSNVVPAQSNLDGSLNTPISTSSSQPRVGSEFCVTCQLGTWPDPDGQRCTPCASVTPRNSAPVGDIACCTASTTSDGMCLTYVEDTTISGFLSLNRFTSYTTSVFIQQHLKASFHLCRMNLKSLANSVISTRVLLSNATACQVLANIAAMQLYYDVTGYAYNYYYTYIWNPQETPAIWTVSTVRTSIPFLAYPTTYYDEISSSSYNWIPASFNENDIINFKLAKYSPTGQLLGLFDAVDAIMQLCGGAYTDGRAAFTFGTQFKRSCNIRADALWNSTLYETAFFDPYIVFTRSGSEYMLPTPVVITNYVSATGAYPNQNADESKWIYNRRFFLFDRISGVAPSTDGLQNIRYAKSITILNTLITGGSYVQPPVVVVEYADLSSSSIGKGTLLQVSFESQYRMNLDTHIRDIWIAVGVLSGLGIILAFARTSVWQTRSGRIVTDLLAIGRLFLFLSNILATIFFIVMAGVSLWWLIFFKRQDSIYLVLPTTFQQASFTALVVISFALKTFDILHLIIRQANVDIFFIDWEKPKAQIVNTVSVWRTYFVANEFNEIQTFRRINVVFQLFFVLFLLKVINLENVATAQPGVNLFPSSADYVPGYNGMLRVGIAFTMWLATGLIQYLVYVLLYQRFIEDPLLNFIDLCSVSNISVFMLADNLYGYYIHGRSPHGTTDVNMKDMVLNLERESKKMIGTRGLQAKSDEQTFIIRIGQPFRRQYDVLLGTYRSGINTRAANKTDEKESEVLMTSYRNLNDFLCAFINHSLPAYNYSIRDRFFIEKVLNHEFQVSNPGGTPGEEESIFFVDSDKNFTRTIFAGHENSLFIWNMATFLFIDYFAFNYVLAAVITYLLNLIAVKMRESLGRKNLSAKTLIPKNFLI